MGAIGGDAYILKTGRWLGFHIRGCALDADVFTY
jgi:hypothetical protein